MTREPGSSKIDAFSISEIRIDGILYKVDPPIKVQRSYDVTMSIYANMKKIVIYPFVSALIPE